MRRPELPDAACRTPEGEKLFIRTGKRTAAQLAEALAICAGCIDRAECEDWAVRHEDSGIWAGLTRDGLRRLRAERGVVLVELRSGDVVASSSSVRRRRADDARIRNWAAGRGLPLGRCGPIPEWMRSAYRAVGGES